MDSFGREKPYNDVIPERLNRESIVKNDKSEGKTGFFNGLNRIN